MNAMVDDVQKETPETIGTASTAGDSAVAETPAKPAQGAALADLLARAKARSSSELAAQTAPSALPKVEAPVAPEIPSSDPEDTKNRIAEALQREQEEAQRAQGPLPRIRTYKADLASVIRKSKVSLLGMVAAESEKVPAKKVAEEKSAEQKPFPWMLVGIGVFIVLGLGALGAAVVFMKPKAPVYVETFIPAPIFTNAENVFSARDMSHYQLMSTLAERRDTIALSLGEIAHERIIGENNRELTAAEVLGTFGEHAPPELLRAADGYATVGFHAFNHVQPFIIVPIASYELAFAAMLEWEKDMPQDLAPLFPSTPTAAVPVFDDQVLRNIDARIFFDPAAQETTRILYAFPNKDTLIITTNDATFRELLSRLANAR